MFGILNFISAFKIFKKTIVLILFYIEKKDVILKQKQNGISKKTNTVNLKGREIVMSNFSQSELNWTLQFEKS